MGCDIGALVQEIIKLIPDISSIGAIGGGYLSYLHRKRVLADKKRRLTERTKEYKSLEYVTKRDTNMYNEDVSRIINDEITYL